MSTNPQRELAILRGMTPLQKLAIVWKLHEWSLAFFASDSGRGSHKSLTRRLNVVA